MQLFNHLKSITRKTLVSARSLYIRKYNPSVRASSSHGFALHRRQNILVQKLCDDRVIAIWETQMEIEQLNTLFLICIISEA